MSKSVQIRVDGLVGFYASLVRALGESGIGGNQLSEVFASHQWADCVQCGIKITGEEIDQILVAEEGTQLSHPKLQRLRLGYCARQGCESGYYCVHLEDHPGVDWDALVEKANDLVVALKAAAHDEERSKASRRRRRQLRNVALGLIIIVILLALRFVVEHGRLPFGHKPHNYTIDPASATRPAKR